jgi:hypothetical protein
MIVQIDLDEKELAILEQAMYIYSHLVEKEDREVKELWKKKAVSSYEQGGPVTFCCCFSDEKPPIPPYYWDLKFCKALREKIRQAQMCLPMEEQPDRYTAKGYDKYISGSERMKW